MLPLDSPKWSELTHAYGEATNIPDLLSQLKTAPPPMDFASQTWHYLWSSLCHQGDVYTASYAAVPYMASFASTNPIKERVTYIGFVGSIEANRHKDNAPTIPEFLKEEYFNALEQTARLVLDCLEIDWDEGEYKELFGTLAAIRGKGALGHAILMMSDETTCPVCDTIFVTDGYEPFKVTIESEGIREFREGGSGYEAWLAENPHGFVLFVPFAQPLTYIIQHRVGCSQLKSMENSKEYFKVCAPDHHRVMYWLWRYGLSELNSTRKCEVCMP